MKQTDRQTGGQKDRSQHGFMFPTVGRGHNNNTRNTDHLDICHAVSDTVTLYMSCSKVKAL